MVLMAEVLSKTLGERTVQTGSVSKGKDTSKSLQMTGRALMTPDELKIMPKDMYLRNRAKFIEQEHDAVWQLAAHFIGYRQHLAIDLLHDQRYEEVLCFIFLRQAKTGMK